MARRRPRLAALRILCGALTVAACQDPTTPAEPHALAPPLQLEPAAPPPAHPAPANPQTEAPLATPTPDPPTQSPPSDPAPTTKPTDAAHPLPTHTPGPLDATAVDRGVLVVWSRHDIDTDKSDLLAVLLDDRGLVRDAPRLVRRTSGQILDLAVHRRDGAAWIAWVALLAEEPRPRALVAALQLEADLSGAHPPITLDQFSDENLLAWNDRALIRVRDLASGHAAVAAAAATARCTDIVRERPTDCPGYKLAWVHQDGSIIRAGHTGPDGGDPGIGSLIDVGTGVLFDTWAWHGGATFSTMFAAYDQPVSPAPFEVVHCRPPFTRLWSGSELVTLCPNDFAEDGQQCQHNGVAEAEGECQRIHVTAPGPIKPSPIAMMTFRKQRCINRKPVLELRWPGGKRILDVQAPGASFDDLVGVWTGSHDITVNPDGTRERWNCGKRELELDGYDDRDRDIEFPLDPQDPRPLPALP